ncbi:MAG: Pelagibacter phage [Bacteroidota bacterium]
MAMFGLTDIQIKTEQPEVDYSLNAGEHLENVDPSIYRYPLNLGSSEVPHHMLFTIYAQEYNERKVDVGEYSGFDDGNQTAKYRRNYPYKPGSFYSTTEDGASALVKMLGQYSSTLVNTFNSVTQNWKEETKKQVANEIVTGVKNFTDSLNFSKTTGENFLNRVKKIKNSIALYMPDSLQFGHSQAYSEVSTNFGMYTAGANIVNDLLSGKGVNNAITKNLSPFMYQALQSLPSNIGTVGFTALTNSVVNPQLELIYSSPNMREFTFSFAFYPRSSSEAKQVSQIINLFKFHAAPEIKEGDAGFFLIPPSLFDIQFMYRGNENKNLPVLGSCVLTSIDVNYAPHGWAAYETFDRTSEFGGSGNPVATTMTLRFKETIVHAKQTLQNWSTQTTA